MISQDGLLHLGPLGDEICDHLKLYSLLASELDGLCAKLYHSLGNMTIGLLVAKDVTEWELGDNSYLVCLEIMAELSGRDQECIQELLDLWIPSLRLIQDLANEIN
jgi:hypothetical protein